MNSKRTLLVITMLLSVSPMALAMHKRQTREENFRQAIIAMVSGKPHVDVEATKNWRIGQDIEGLDPVYESEPHTNDTLEKMALDGSLHKAIVSDLKSKCLQKGKDISDNEWVGGKNGLCEKLAQAMSRHTITEMIKNPDHFGFLYTQIKTNNTTLNQSSPEALWTKELEGSI